MFIQDINLSSITLKSCKNTMQPKQPENSSDKTSSQRKYSQSSHKSLQKPYAQYHHISFFDITSLKTLGQSQKYRGVHDTLLQILDQNSYQNPLQRTNKSQVYSNILGLQIVQNFAKLKYRYMQRLMTYEFFKLYWVEKEGIFEYIRFGIQFVQRQIVEGKNQLHLQDYYLVMSVLDSINELLLVLPDYILEELNQIQVEDNVSKKQKKSSKPNKKQQHSLDTVRVPILELYCSILSNLPGLQSQKQQASLQVQIYKLILDIRKLKIRICQNKIEILNEADPQKNISANDNKEGKKRIKKSFNQIWDHINDKDISQWKFIYNTKLQRDLRYILENIFTKQDHALLDKKTLQNLQKWYANSYKHNKGASWQIQRLWAKMIQYCRQTKEYPQKRAIIQRNFDSTAISYTYEKDRFDYLLRKYVRAVIEIKKYIKQVQKKYLQKPQNAQKFAGDLLHKIKKNYDQILVENSFLPEYTQNKPQIDRMYQEFGVLKIENFKNHELSPYEILIAKSQREVKLEYLSKLHFRGFLEIIQHIAKKKNLLNHEQQQLGREITSLETNFNGDQQQVAILFEKIVLFQLRNSRAVRVSLQTDFGEKMRRLLQQLVKSKDKQSLRSQLVKLELLFEHKKYIQGILFLKKIQNYWKILQQNSIQLGALKTYEIWKIIQFFLSKDRKQVKFSIKEVNQFKNSLKDKLTIQDSELIQIILFLYDSTTEQKTPNYRPARDKSMENAGDQIEANEKQLMRIYYKNENNRYTYFVYTYRVRLQIQKVREQLARIREDITMMKIFKIKSIEINEREYCLEIVIEPRKFSFDSTSQALKYIIQTLSELKQLNLDPQFKHIKFWYFFFTKNHLKIRSQNQRLICQLLPLEAILTRLLLPKNELEKKLQGFSLNYPFIHFTNQIIRPHFRSFLNQSNKYLEEELEYTLNQLKCIEMENQPHKNNIEEFLLLPLFWSIDKKMTSIVNFSQTFHNQLRLEQARRKKNIGNLQILDKAFSSQKNKEKRQILQQIRSQFHSRTHQQKDEFSSTREKTKKKRQQVVNKRLGVLGQKLGQIQYQTSNKMNITSSYFYVVEGIFEKDAYIMNLCNSQKRTVYQEHPEALRFGRDYDWFQGKPEIKKFIVDQSIRESIKNNKLNKINNSNKNINQENYIQSQSQSGSQQENYLPSEQQLEKNIFKRTYKSFQNHLYFMRCFLSHSQKKEGPNKESIQINLSQKIKILSENYPKIYVFLHKWRNFIGKPMYEKSLPQFEESNQNYKKMMDKIYQLRNQHKKIKESQQLRLQLPEYLQQPGTVKQEIVKTLKALFPQKRKNNTDRIKILEEKLPQYANTRLFPGYKNYKFPLWQKYILNLPQQKVDYCNACGIFALGIKKSYIYTNKQKRQGYVSLWAFLDEVKQANFNYLFHEHQSNLHCVWTNQQNVCYYYHNMKLRKKVVRDEKATYKKEGGNTALLDKIQFDQAEEKRKKEEKMKMKIQKRNRMNRNNHEQNEIVDKTSWQKYQQICKENKNYQDQLKSELEETDYLPKGFLYHFLINYPNFIQVVRESREIWDQKIKEQVEIGQNLC